MRPQIICHMITSIDGRLSPSRWSDAADASIDSLIDDNYENVAHRLEGQGWIVGRKTMAEYVEEVDSLPALPAPAEREHHLTDREGRDLAIAVDLSGRLRFEAGRIGEDHALVILGTQVSDAVLEAHRNTGVSYVFAGVNGEEMAQALDVIGAEYSVTRLLLEGGGITNGAFLAAQLIDEFSMLICPTVDGLKGSPAIIDYVGDADALPAKNQHLRLKSCEVLNQSVIWMRHDVIKSSGN